MKLAAHRMSHIIKHVCYKDPLITGKIDRLCKTCIIDIIGTTPSAIYPMRACFQYVVLKVILVVEQHSLFSTFLGKLSQTAPIPTVRTGQIILSQSIPSFSLSATRKRLFIERSP